jgi:serine/threonine protein kinase
MPVDGPPPGSAPDSPTSSPTQGTEPSGSRRIGGYSVQRELGRGGMGAVYLAEHNETHEKVALKELLITAAADPIAVQRFLQEGAVMSRLTHPNIVRVRGIIEAGAGHYLALEYIEGGSLRDLLRGRPLPNPQAFAVMHGLLQALEHAHQHAIVHRDVKPENVMLSRAGEVKVADFGIARLTDEAATSNATKTGTTVGTPQYMSPEQVTTSKVDGRSDLYSAGIVCYEVFCGRPPFEATAADGPFTLFAKHVQAPPPPPTVIRPGLDPGLEAVILRSLSKRPEDRYQTGAEFDRALSSIASRLCGPDWLHSLEPGADLARMVPLAATMTSIPAGGLGAAPPPAPPTYSPRPPGRPPAANPAGSPNLPLLGGVAAAVVVVLLVIAFVVFGSRFAGPAVTPTAATSPTPVAGPCEFLRAGVGPAAGTGGTCGLRLASQLEADSFAGQSSLPADLTGVAIDASGVARGKASIPVGGGFAALTVGARGSGIGVVTGPTPADEVVIADFTPVTTGDANFGVGARCTPADCVMVYVSPRGKVWISQRLGGAVAVEKFSEPAEVPVNQLSRLVVAVRGTQVEAWLNGNLISSAPIEVASPGPVLFLATNQDLSPATVNLSALYVYGPG